MPEPKTIRSIEDLRPDLANANLGTERGLRVLDDSLRECGAGRSILADRDGTVIAGNKTLERAADIGLPVRVVQTNGEELVVVQRTDLDLGGDDGQRERARRLAYLDNFSSEQGLQWDATQILADLEAGVDLEGLWRDDELTELLAGLVEPEAVADPGAQLSKADELQEKWQVSLGDVWQCGEHRICCGDCTDAAVVEKVMQGERATLCHADPPYGMGKTEIANDNLYRQKLDAFQMEWWKACRPHLEDNGSVYIWGNAEDLWRLWFCGGLRDSERLTLRNEVVWDKWHGQGMESEQHRMFPTVTERVLFFMLGEQGFNINADNYWEGWETIRVYLKNERDKMGWDNARCKELAGHSPTSGCHWFDRSQWTMPTREVYEAWQAAARDYDAFKRDYDAFKRDYDELKRDFYATRAYFDNTHDNMTDVWQFGRVQGDERHGHVTPKPVEMMERVIMSSSPKGGVVLVPFAGTFPESVACEQLGRKCRGIEIHAPYVAVCLERLSQMQLPCRKVAGA